MFEFFKRVKTLVGAEFNHALDKAEDPVKMLEQYLREMGSDIVEVEKSVATQIANEKLLKRQLDEAVEMVEKRENQALQALEKENEELAMRTIEDKIRYQKEVSQLTELHNNAVTISEDLKRKLTEMKKEFREMEIKKDSLKARAQTAKTITKVNRAMSSVNTDGAKKGFERMEEKVMRYEAEAETSQDLANSDSSLDKEFEKMNGSSAVSEELKKLKEQLNNKNKEQ